MGIMGYNPKSKRGRTKEKQKEKQKEDQKTEELEKEQQKEEIQKSEEVNSQMKNEENNNEDLISFHNIIEPNIEISKFENDEDNKIDENNRIIDEKDTNIILAVNILESQFRNSSYFNLYFGSENTIEPIFTRKINNYLVLFYHIPIKEENIKDKTKIEDNQKIKLIVDRHHSYHTSIKYLYYHINFYYDINWELSSSNKDATEMPEINYKISYIFYFLLKFLKISDVSNALIGDILENFYKYLNKKKEIIFEDLLYLLIESYKIKNENLIKKIIEMFENKNITFKRSIDSENLILDEDLNKFFFKEEEKKEENNKENEEKKDKE